ncbi:MAG: hypothetical protein CL820_10730 [Croceicoccus sp.]|nr:hypothetical protein [Croceicoccus sp.]MAL26350.1 hypothetical protein [Croceicoccus sp.]|tara:strand:+ start:5588 stop:6385 length:798 start_codon:yes stop_codon:yes gene_type:complete
MEEVFLQMWGPNRSFLVRDHEFYVQQAKQRLLDPFDEKSMLADSQRHEQAWLEERSGRFDPDRDDEGQIYEDAEQEKCLLYASLEGLRDNTRLSIIAGMFHEWEKQFRDWLGRNLGELGLGEHTHKAIWKSDFEDLMGLMTACGWPVKGQDWYDDLNLCRLVVNVYKHGNGKSRNDLSSAKASLLKWNGKFSAYWSPSLDYSTLMVSDADLDAFAASILRFWQEIPDNIYFSRVSALPRWLSKEMEKDHHSHRVLSGFRPDQLAR